jgi:hypothetical protein
MTPVRLPVAGIDVVLRAPAGADDLLLLEGGPPGMSLALDLLSRLAARADGAPLDVAALPIGDVDVLLLRLRQRLLGDAISAEDLCRAANCRARVDVSFSIGAYLTHHLPGAVADVAPAAGEGWYRLGDVEFRLPRAADELAIALAREPEEELLRRCVRAPILGEAARARVEQAMETMSPSLYSELEGACPECGAAVETTFDPRQYTLRELRDRAALVYEDICAIAHYFHWSEAEILALPAARRSRYAQLAVERAQRDTRTM